MRKPKSTGPLLDFAVHFDSEEALELPLSMLMQTIFIGGNKGSGKTSALKRLYEAAYKAGAQCGAIAPLGRWWSLRIAKNGRSKGLRDVYVFGGKHADVPITANSGRSVARTVVTQRIHFVLDVGLMRKNDRAQFLGDFLEELWQLKKEEDASHAMVLFIDEAQVVAPQKSTSKEVERMREFAADLCREGRNHGVGMVLGAQRSANVDKDLLALVEMLIVMRTIHHLDRKVYKAWVDEKGSEDDDDGAWLRRLRRLNKGDAYLYAPEFNVFERVQIRLPDTFDATKTAQIGERVAKIGSLSKLDVRRLGEELARVVEESEANDPAVLRRKIAELQAELDRKGKTVITNAKKVEVSVLKDRHIKMLEKVANRAADAVDRFADVGKKFSSDVSEILIAISKAKPKELTLRGMPIRKQDAIVSLERKTEKPKKPVGAEVKNGAYAASAPLAKGAVKILVAIAQHHSLGVTREQITVLTGYKVTSRNTYLQHLKSAGLIEDGVGDAGESIVATQQGVGYLGDSFQPLPTGDALREHWMQNLPEGERKILTVVVNAFPASVRRETIDEQTGYKTTSRNTYLQKLHARQLVYSISGEVKASPMLFN